VNRLKEFLPPFLVVTLFFIVWEFLVKVFNLPLYFLPPPSRIISLIYEEKVLLFSHALVTVEEILLGFTLAFICGVILAFLIFLSKVLERSIYPLVISSQTIPVFAIAPLLILWLGYGIAPKVIMTALIVFFPICVNTIDGLRAADEDAVNLLRVMGASEWEIIKKVRIPSALPFIFSGTKIGVAVSPIGAVIGEWVGSMKGLGYLMIHANAQLRVDLIFASIFALSLIAIASFGLVSLLENIFLPWRKIEERR